MRERRPADATEVVRPDYLTHSSKRERAANDPLVVVPLSQLLDSIRDAVAEACGSPSPGSKLLDRQQLAEKLGVSTGTLHKLRSEGLPCLYVGDSPRFIYEDVVRWMSERQAQP